MDKGTLSKCAPIFFFFKDHSSSCSEAVMNSFRNLFT